MPKVGPLSAVTASKGLETDKTTVKGKLMKRSGVSKSTPTTKPPQIDPRRQKMKEIDKTIGGLEEKIGDLELDIERAQVSKKKLVPDRTTRVGNAFINVGRFIKDIGSTTKTPLLKWRSSQFKAKINTKILGKKAEIKAKKVFINSLKKESASLSDKLSLKYVSLKKDGDLLASSVKILKKMAYGKPVQLLSDPKMKKELIAHCKEEFSLENVVALTDLMDAIGKSTADIDFVKIVNTIEKFVPQESSTQLNLASHTRTSVLSLKDSFLADPSKENAEALIDGLTKVLVETNQLIKDSISRSPDLDAWQPPEITSDKNLEVESLMLKSYSDSVVSLYSDSKLFTRVMGDEELVGDLRGLATKVFATENLDYIEEVFQEFSKDEFDLEAVKGLADRFISTDSSEYVNIDSKTRKKIITAMETLSTNSDDFSAKTQLMDGFTDSSKEILKLINEIMVKGEAKGFPKLYETWHKKD